MSKPETPPNPLQIFGLSGRVAIVTGAAGGVGRACAEVLSGVDATVVCADIQSSKETVDIITGRGGTAHDHRTDVTSRAEVRELVSATVARFGRLDVMINNAGTHIRKTALETTEEELDTILSINLKGVFFGCQAAGEVMRDQGSGSIVNIASEAIDRSAPEIAAYGASKAGVRQITRTFAVELAPYGVRVNAIAPGWMLTPLTRKLHTDAESRVDEAALAARMESRRAMAPLGRTGTGADVAYAALYLASEASAWVTGQALRPNGGTSMPW